MWLINLKNLETQLLAEAGNNTRVWFNAEKSPEILKNNMNLILRCHEKYDPQIKIKCNENYMTLFDENKNIIKFADQNIKLNDEIKSIIVIDGVYILNNGTFGWILKLKAAIHYKMNDIIDFDAFV